MTIVSSNSSSQLDTESRRIFSPMWLTHDKRSMKELGTQPTTLEADKAKRKLMARRECEDRAEARRLAKL